MIEWEKIKRISIKERKHKVKIEDFAIPYQKGGSFKNFLDSLPKILKGKELREMALRITEAKKKGKPIIFLIGAHVVKCGLSPLLIEMAQKGWISMLSTHGATTIHDLEIAFTGETSEDVAESLKRGMFGMVEETPRLYAQAVKIGLKENLGLGEALGKFIHSNPSLFPYRDHSLLYNFYRLSLPFTVHIAVGTDTLFQHPEIKGSELGELSHRDFLKFASELKRLKGGCILNIGSAVIMPEVFLKAFSLVKNLGYSMEEFTAVNFDMIEHYRPRENVLRRPGGTPFSFLGHHEIMIPLLFAILKEVGE